MLKLVHILKNPHTVKNLKVAFLSRGTKTKSLHCNVVEPLNLALYKCWPSLWLQDRKIVLNRTANILNGSFFSLKVL